MCNDEDKVNKIDNTENSICVPESQDVDQTTPMTKKDEYGRTPKKSYT